MVAVSMHADIRIHHKGAVVLAGPPKQLKTLTCSAKHASSLGWSGTPGFTATVIAISWSLAYTSCMQHQLQAAVAVAMW